MKLPRISVVTPSFEQAAYLEQTIQSVLGQDYPNLEYIVIDGGSRDGSVDILRRYDRQLAYWVSEPDAGQTDAIARGFEKSTGEILCWLCSDDLLKSGALWIAAGAFVNDPELEVLYGDTEYLYPDGARKRKGRVQYDYEVMLYAFNIIAQPSSFFRKSAYERAGGLDRAMNFAMDYDLFLRMGRNVRIAYVPLLLSSYRLHRGSKTASRSPVFEMEWSRAREKALGRKCGVVDKVKWWIYTAKVVFKFWAERGELKIGYDKSKYRL